MYIIIIGHIETCVDGDRMLAIICEKQLVGGGYESRQ